MNQDKNMKKTAETLFQIEAMKELNKKPGIKTTEFWGKSFIQLGTMLGFYFGLPISPDMLIGAVSGVEAIYTLGRSITKAFSK